MKTKKTASGIRVYCSHDKIVPIDELVPNPQNPNQHPDEQIEMLAKIIQENGWRNAITVSNLSGMIVKGHGRYQAAARAGLSDVPVDYQDYDSRDAEIKDLIADNKIAELSEIDDEAANKILSDLGMMEIDFETLGYYENKFKDSINQADELEKNKKGMRPEVEFTQEMLESSNYILLVFDNEIDWLQAQSIFDLKTVKALHSKKGFKCQGVGRVMNGPDAIEKLKKYENFD